MCPWSLSCQQQSSLATFSSWLRSNKQPPIELGEGLYRSTDTFEEETVWKTSVEGAQRLIKKSVEGAQRLLKKSVEGAQRV